MVFNIMELHLSSHFLCETYVSLSETSSPSSGQFLCEPMMSSPGDEHKSLDRFGMCQCL